MPRSLIKEYLPRRQCKILIRRQGLVNNVRKEVLDYYREKVYTPLIAQVLDAALAIMDNDKRKTLTVQDLERALSLLTNEIVKL